MFYVGLIPLPSPIFSLLLVNCKWRTKKETLYKTTKACREKGIQFWIIRESLIKFYVTWNNNQHYFWLGLALGKLWNKRSLFSGPTLQLFILHPRISFSRPLPAHTCPDPGPLRYAQLPPKCSRTHTSSPSGPTVFITLSDSLLPSQP